MELTDYINSQVPIDKACRETIETAFKREAHTKGSILLTPENHSQKLIFVESGLLRMYYQIEDKVITFLFLNENAMMMPLESIFYNKPDPYGWEVLQDCTIRSIQYEEALKLIDTIPAYERFTLMESFKVLKQMSDKLYALQFQSAEDRYKKMLNSHPDILLRASLGHIASYLGITQQTLSVIRAKKI